ncbi:transmembrane protein, putative (macronuclear) [Tetrahymena thermophila SB210]|uniref:Transmembrane protein, putative n=1 Tax=Tetrahymena thermophila (strain SB210) TaxID=312017 RepID=Q22KW4_TETTS|nr:transmembrane protein, putative [Tetrahymena thermophila SB210]EAR85914.2 transmembrane protein, putative [Tetrahymena thermophila SB210]|eukprot:XP_976509.2 transmembrane protein, putative [Tetrahymena thermophila SB210]
MSFINVIIMFIQTLSLFLRLKCQQYTYPDPDKIYIQTYTLINYGGDVNKTISIPYKLQCQDRKLLVGNLNLDFPTSQNGFIIDSSNKNQTQVTFNIYKDSVQISFFLAEICIDQFYVANLNITNPQFKNKNKLDYTDKPSNFTKNMVAYAYITGVLYDTISIQSLFIESVQTQEDGFHFILSKESNCQINFISINYIYYEELQNESSYYQIFQYNDLQYLQKGQNSVTSDIQIYPNYGCPEQQYCLMIGLNGYYQNSEKEIRQKIIPQFISSNAIQIQYITWGDSQLLQIQSSILLIQMIVCTGKLANFQDKCQKCPVGYYLSIDLRSLNRCQKCDDSCYSCEKNAQNCLICKDLIYMQFKDKKCQCIDSTMSVDKKNNICICNDSQTMKQNSQLKKCDCIDQDLMKYDVKQKKCLCLEKKNLKFDSNQNKCVCSDMIKMIFNTNQMQCECKDTMIFDDSNQICECADKQNMQYDQNKGICECKETMAFNNKISKCQCIDVNNMHYNINTKKCECNELMIYNENNKKCECADLKNMNYFPIQAKCSCKEKMNFNVNENKCICADQDNMKYNSVTAMCDCPSEMIFSSILQVCICQNSSQYYDKDKKQCLLNPSSKNCDILDQFGPQCQKCKNGFQNHNGYCKYCGKGKFFDELTKTCSSTCQEYCYQCSDNQTCNQYQDEFPCHFSCQLCQIPNSAKGCNICSSDTRQFNSTDNSCNCKFGFEEVNKADCNQIQQSFSQQFLTFKSVISNVSYYLQLIQAIFPFYPHIQYSFMIQQQIGILAYNLPGKNDINDMRIELLKGYQTYNFNFFEQIQLIQSDNQETQNQINYLIISALCFAFMLLFKLSNLIFKTLQQKFWYQKLQQQGFIIISRLISAQVLYTTISILLNLNKLDKFIKELILVAINLAALVLFLIIQTQYSCFLFKQNKKQTDTFSICSFEQAQQVQNNNSKTNQTIMINDICIIKGNKYLIWTAFELRKIITAVLILKMQSKINLFVVGSLQIAFGCILLLRIFNNQIKQIYNIFTEIILAAIYFLSALSYNTSPENVQEGLQFKKPSIVDIIIIVAIFLIQVFSTMNCSYYYYQIIKQFIMKKQQKQKLIQDTHIQFQQFPQEFNASKINLFILNNFKVIIIIFNRYN